jgi:hypothetical protein
MWHGCAHRVSIQAFVATITQTVPQQHIHILPDLRREWLAAPAHNDSCVYHAHGAGADELSSEALSDLALVAASAAAAPASSSEHPSDKALFRSNNLRLSAELLNVVSKAHLLRSHVPHRAAAGATGVVQV